VESEVGEGTTFTLRLPLASRAAPRSVRPESENAPASSVRRRLLVVDDEPSMGQTISRVLGRTHDVVVETNPRVALDRLRDGEHFDLLLCDLMMPEMSGAELHAELEALGSPLARDMVILSGGAFTAGAREFLARVPNPRVDKPFDIRELRATVAEVLRVADERS